MQPARPWNLVNIVSLSRKRGNICCGNKMFLQQMIRVRVNGETVRETCFCKNVSATMFPRLRGPLLLSHFNPLSPDIFIHIFPTGLHTFHWLLIGRTWLNIKTIHLWWSLPKFSWPVFVIVHRYDEEKIGADHFWGLKSLELSTRHAIQFPYLVITLVFTDQWESLKFNNRGWKLKIKKLNLKTILCILSLESTRYSVTSWKLHRPG